MKKIGREVLFLKAGDGNPRNGEGAFIRLRDGRILYAFTEFTGDSWEDHCSARIGGIFSCDEGETWQGRCILLSADEGASNFMSVSFLRMENGDVGMFYLRKDKETGTCKLYLVRSADEGKTWESPVCCLEEDGYFVVNNDRVIRLQNGRLLVPAAQHAILKKWEAYGKGELNFFASDDDGRTWSKLLCENIHIPAEEKSTTGLQEPGVIQLENGAIWAWIRTGFGCQYECFSNDGGASWSTPAPSEFFTSPASPMQVKRVGAHTAAVFNPIPNYTTRGMGASWGRTPLVCAVSKDGGNTFGSMFYLEDDPKNGYCYPAIFEGEGYFLVAYYHSDNSGTCLFSNKIVKVLFEELN